MPIFLVTMAFLAVSSDAKNQEKYKQQQAEMLARMEARKATENFTAEEESAASENH